MAVAAYASVLSLLRVVDNIQHPSHLRFFPDTTQVDALRAKLCSLQDFFELHNSSTITEDIECLARKIPRVACDAEILIHNHMADHLYKELYPQNGRIPKIDRVIHMKIYDTENASSDTEDQSSDTENGSNETKDRSIDRENASSDTEDRPSDTDNARVIQKINRLSFHYEMHRVILKIDSINKALRTLRTSQHDQEKPGRVLNKFTGDKPPKNKMVGFDDQLNQVLEKLSGNEKNLVIVPIVGMGGIGKTTLARSLYDHPYNLHHFQVRIWSTISQDYSVKRVLQGILKDEVLGGESESELITRLHQKLFGQRYLIVLDDVWSLEVWDDLKRGFPSNGKGSRVIVTTRLCDIANSLDSWNNSYSMKFLDEDKSWDLFSEKAFEKGGRSLELEKIGRKISKQCKGLPLLLVLIGGLLANSNMKVEYWQTFGEDINSFANSANDEYCLRILSSSYHHLPIHLKPCFLYMRHTPEDSYIKVSELIEKWISEGFVKPMRGKTLEEAAITYLEDLIGRNMFLIRERGSRGNIKICGIHDLLRDLSIKESKKEQFLELPRMISVKYYGVGDIEEVCVICYQQKRDMRALNSEILGSVSDSKILVCSSCQSSFPEFPKSKFLMAVELGSQRAPLPTTCRSTAFSYVARIFFNHTLRLIWNLEILDIGHCYAALLPKELWEMYQLRHVKVRSLMFLEPVSTKNDIMVLENLQTLETVVNFKFTEEIVRRIPYLRKLGLSCDDGYVSTNVEEDFSCFYLQNLAHLQKLESLCISFRSTMDFMKVIAFPCSLKKLTLLYCKIAWEDLTIIGSLPNLEVLKLDEESVLGEEWNPVEGEFLSLKYLKLVDLNLVHWRVDGTTHFPALETLFLGFMRHLEAIPLEVRELPYLNLIYLKDCSKGIIDSASDMVEEQLSYGNERLAVHVEESFRRTYRIGGAY